MAEKSRPKHLNTRTQISILTDICIELLRGNKKIIERIDSVQQTIAISFITVAELYYGAEKSNRIDKNKASIEKLLFALVILESTIEIEKKFGELKATLDKSGNLMEDADLFIASTCLENCDYLVTGNTKHYNRIKELEIQNWIR